MNRHKIKVIQAYAIIASFVIVGIVVGFVIGRVTSPKKVETITLTETFESPNYESDSLPESSEVYYFNVPLSHSLQRYIYEICSDENVPVTLVMAMIEHESNFNPEVVSTTNDFGLMQINAINIGEMILLNGHLYKFGVGALFDSIPGIVLAPIDLVVLVITGGITALLFILLNRGTKTLEKGIS